MVNFVNLIKKSSLIHPSRNMDFEELRTGLFEEVDNGNINTSYHNVFSNLVIFKYSQQCVIEKNWNQFTIMARGLVLDLKNSVVVATPFIKFWNYNEILSIGDIIELDFLATEKKDGSLGICFWNNSRWMICTCGSFISEQAQWADNYLQKKINHNFLKKGTTYLFEIIYPGNRIVVPYTEDSLCLLSAYDDDGYEINKEELDIIAKQVNFERPEVYDFDELDKILYAASVIDHTREGFVIRFKSGVRVKVKGDEYCRIHKLISRVTPIAVWEMLLNGDDMDRSLIDLPEEMESDYKQIVSVLENKLTEILEGIEYAYEKTKHLSNKELGLELKNKESKILEDEIVKRFQGNIFARRKGTFLEEMKNVNSLTRKGIYRKFRPKSNFLEGYSPSSAMNRFNDG